MLLLAFMHVFIFFLSTDSLSKKTWSTVLTYTLLLSFSAFNRKIFTCILIVLSLVVVFFFPTIKIYGKPDLSYVASVIYTNKAESISYLKMVSLDIWLIILIYFVLTFLTIKLKPTNTLQKTPLILACLLLLYSPIKRVYYYGFTEKNMTGFYSRIPVIQLPSNYIYLIIDVVDQYKFVIEESKKPSTFEIIDDLDKKLKNHFVLVIDESVRKDFLNSYGFPINNTPFINSTPNIQFENFFSVSFGTIQSLTRTLSVTPQFPQYDLQNNIVNLAKKIGYETYWISNQGQIGLWDSPNAIIAKSSDHYEFLKKGTSSDNLRIADTDLLPLLNKSMADKPDKPKFIVLHLIGSHPSICDRTNDQYDEFILSTQLSCYNKSIKNTDNLLKKIHSKVSKISKNNFNLVYLSDHGLRINENLTLTHGRTDKQVYEVPLLVWGNDIVEKDKIKAPRNGRDFLTLFTQIHNIKTSLVKDDYKFISEEPATGNPYQIIGLDEKLFDYRNLENNNIPKFIPETK